MYVWAAKSLKSQIVPLRRFRSIFADCPVCGFLWIFHCCVYYWKHSQKLTKSTKIKKFWKLRKNAVFSRIDHFHSQKTLGSSWNWKKVYFFCLTYVYWLFNRKTLMNLPIMLKNGKIQFFSIWAGATSSRAVEVIDTWKNCIFSQFLEFFYFA